MEQSQLIFNFDPPKVPLDSDGFVQSFTVDQVKESQKFFDFYGFVVYRDVLTKEEVDLTVNEIWEHLRVSAQSLFTEEEDLPHPEKPHTWFKNWCTSKQGIPQDLALGRQCWMNRQNPNVYKAFCSILETKELYSSVDRFGILRPTKSVPVSRKFLKEHSLSISKSRSDLQNSQEDTKEEENDDEIVNADIEKWRGSSDWFHWDLNPWMWVEKREEEEKEEENAVSNFLKNMSPQWFKDYVNSDKIESIRNKWEYRVSESLITENNDNNDFNGFIKVQGLLNLCDSKQNGGLHLIPGFHEDVLSQWTKAYNQFANSSFVVIPPDHLERFKPFAVKVYARSGSLIIWSSELPHCNYCNEGKTFRYCQYIKMFPKSVTPQPIRPLRESTIRELLPKDFPITEIGSIVFGQQQQQQQSSFQNIFQ